MFTSVCVCARLHTLIFVYMYIYIFCGQHQHVKRISDIQSFGYVTYGTVYCIQISDHFRVIILRYLSYNCISIVLNCFELPEICLRMPDAYILIHAHSSQLMFNCVCVVLVLAVKKR